MGRGSPEPPNNVFKLPFFVFMGVLGAFLVVIGLAESEMLLLVCGILLVVIAVPVVHVIRRGRNPWWLRAPLDRR